ncbi:hypothetical protein AU15_10330 [Marinobacter salarius]|nr:hypothetical protein AU15_10330 [Marinobacter salarius]
MEMPDLGTIADWMWETMIFTATAEIQTLEVIAHSTFGPRADLGIDSFFLGDPGTNPDNPDTPDVPPTASVPTPASLPLFALGLTGVLIAGLRRRRQC